MSLYRKYRPKNFSSLIGQNHIKTTLLNAILSNQLAHAYLFAGPRGTGKTSTARLLAKAINIEGMTEQGEFEESDLTQDIDQGRLIDIIEIDAASNRGIDEMRDLKEKINYSPTRVKNKVYIIDEVHMLTKEAFNALLKTLEEPPSFVYFILATTEIHKVPETIISRCQRFDFRRITDENIIERLKEVATAENIKVEEEALKIIAKQARGGLRNALTLLEQFIFNGKVETEQVKKLLGISNLQACEDIYGLLESCQTNLAIEKLNLLFDVGVDLQQFNKDFLDFLRNQMIENIRENNHQKTLRILEILEYFQESYEKLKYSYIPELPLEVAIVKSCLGKNQKIDQGSKKKPDITEEIKADEQAVESIPNTQANEENNTEISIEKISDTKYTDLTLDQITAKWHQVLGRVNTPLTKRCLMAGKPVESSQGKVVLAFSSNFHKDKFFANEVLVESEEAFLQEFNQRIAFDGIIDASLFGDAVGLESNKKDQVQGNVNSALAVFGGEIVN